MAIRTIVTREDPVLSKVCHPVTKFDGKLSDLLDDLKETLASANGLGLAAPQVGILRRAVIVVDDNGEMLERRSSPGRGSRTAWRAACPSPACGAM